MRVGPLAARPSRARGFYSELVNTATAAIAKRGWWASAPPARNNMEMEKSSAPPRARARFAAAARLPPANGQRARSRQSYCQCCGIWQHCRRPGTSLRSTGAVTIGAVPTRRSRCHHRSHRLRSGRSETDPIGPRRRRSQNSPRRILRLLRRQYCCLKGPKPLEIPKPSQFERHRPPDMVSAAPKNIDKCRCQMLKMAAAMAIFKLRLVDDCPGVHGPSGYRF